MEESMEMENRELLAHITQIDGLQIDQSVEQHSFKAAQYAGEALKKVKLYHIGYLGGLMHDFGKCRILFTEYIEERYQQEQNGGSGRARGSVNHTFAAVRYILERYHTDTASETEKITSEILAVAMGCHHGFFDIQDPLDEKKVNGFLHRIKCDEKEIDYQEVKENFFKQVADEQQLDALFQKSCQEINAFLTAMHGEREICSPRSIRLMHSYLVRLVLAAIIEGDRRDTAEFMSGRMFEQIQADRGFWLNQCAYMEERIKGFSKDSPINKARAYISDECKKAAAEKGGIYRLTVPTGGGKTLASLRYALNHAAAFEKERVIFIIPLLSVLDQNSRELRKYIKDSHLLLEHHSNVINTCDDEDELDKNDLLMETWNAPFIVSTMVQLLNILFSHRTSAVRRMKSLCDSVIIIDEVQSLPLKFTELFTTAINFLADFCGSTVILCSATQPAFDKVRLPIHLADKTDLVKLEGEAAEVFKRVNLVDKTDGPGMSLNDLAEFTAENIEQKDSILVICNTKKTARMLFQKLKLLIPDGCQLYHLSTSMCKKHRTDVLDKIGKTPGLNEDRKVICIATQLVEAGMDFSFESVIRIWAGIDSIVQAVGRCNRNNDWQHICDAFLVKLQAESLGPLKDIQTAQTCCGKALYRFRKDPGAFDGDILSKELIELYYKRFFDDRYSKRQFKYPITIEGSEQFIRTMLMDIGPIDSEHPFYFRQAFKTAAKNCKVFDDDKTDIVVRYDDKVDEYIANLCSKKAKRNYGYARKQLDAMKPYTVGLFPYELDELRKNGRLDEDIFEGVIFLDKTAYDESIGVCPDEYVQSDDFLSM
ncbi:CRISPR-associated helicase Cas3' [Anaerovorax odorimutans]|uniref:CRISPR-associated helicase Cas3 n=2 Tax=Anaerovorax odorimutans TaxID=109327 RepID=A0ABT1RLH0_9FIRM|nr:CRISPR-associated helicase Cas3' [Anaerovorax odorimutans]